MNLNWCRTMEEKKMTNDEKAREVARRSYENNYNCKSVSDSFCNSFDMCYVCRTTRAIMQFAEWKDEQHKQSIIDLNCKLEEQQACYEELKKRYDEAVEREKIATKIIEQKRIENEKLIEKLKIYEQTESIQR